MFPPGHFPLPENPQPPTLPKMKTWIVATLVSLLVSIPSFAVELIKPETILGKQEFCISDGSSIYIFSRTRSSGLSRSA